jgi:flavodoxin
MESAIVYASVHHGNTRSVAEAMAASLGASLFTVEEAQTLGNRPLDVVGFGSGIYFGRHHTSLLDLVHNLKSVPRRTFVFSTAGLAFLSGMWHRPLKNVLRQRGCEIVGEFCCPGWDTVGPLWLLGGLHWRRPNGQDLARAAQFAGDLRSRAESQQPVDA